jgi:hypothetical protein
MFALRRITSENNEVNVSLGNAYNYVRKIENKAEYERVLNAWLLGLARGDEDIYGFITHNNGQDIIPLYKKSVYFVMMSDGKTFANITKY